MNVYDELFEKERKEGIKEGIAIGRKEMLKHVIKCLLKDGRSITEIARILEISEEAMKIINTDS